MVLGRPLNVAFPVASDGKSLEDACVRAVVSAGDSPVSPSQVRIAFGTATAGRDAVVRVQTTQAVTEPVLSVRVTAGCNGSVVRNFTLLSYPASALAGAGGADRASLSAPLSALAGKPPIAEPLITVGPAATRATESDVGEGALPAAARPTVSAQRSKAKARTAAATGTSENKRVAQLRRSRSPVVATAPIREQDQPRLVMEPLSGWLAAPAALKYSAEMASVPVPEDSAERAAAASLWRAINMPVDELAQTLKRTSEQASQLAQVQREKASALEAQARLQEQVAESFSATLVYGLCFLLILLAGLAVWLWSRAKRVAHLEQRAWSHAVATTGEPDVGSTTAAPAFAAGTAQQLHSDGAGRLTQTQDKLPSGVMPLERDTVHDEPSQRAADLLQAAAPRDVGSTSAAHAVVNPEALFDLQQQAEFFMSVGEHGQAIEVLRQHIEFNQATSPLAYLELLRLYRSLSRFDDYNNLRAQFHLYFNAQVPEFSAFTRQSKNLFAYLDDLARIEALWANASVAALLREMLFRDNAQEHQRFELAAYDDLLLLHAIASTTPASSRGTSAGRTRTTPNEAASPDNETHDAHSAAMPAAVNLIDFEPDWEFVPSASQQTPPSDGLPAVSPALDLDLSDFAFPEEMAQRSGNSASLPPLTDDLVPSVPTTVQRAPDEPIGFGANSDRFEARLDPEIRKPD